MIWFKLYTEARMDRKLASLSDQQFRIWFNLLCLSAESKTPGTINDIDIKLLALEVANGDDETLKHTVTVLQHLEIVTCVTGVTGRYTVTLHKFQERQKTALHQNRDAIRERVRKHRAKKVLRQTSETDLSSNNNVTSVTGKKRIREEKILNPPDVPPVSFLDDPDPDANFDKAAPKRDAADQSEIDRAVQALSANLVTEHLGSAIRSNHLTPGMIEIPGWKFFRAAKKLLDSVTDGRTDANWRYYCGIIRNLRDDDRVEKPKTQPSRYHVPPAPDYPVHRAPADYVPRPPRKTQG